MAAHAVGRGARTGGHEVKVMFIASSPAPQESGKSNLHWVTAHAGRREREDSAPSGRRRGNGRLPMPLRGTADATGRPRGDPGFAARLETNLGRNLLPDKPDRPRKKEKWVIVSPDYLPELPFGCSQHCRTSYAELFILLSRFLGVELGTRNLSLCPLSYHWKFMIEKAFRRFCFLLVLGRDVAGVHLKRV